jgi:hypothetical protein
MYENSTENERIDPMARKSTPLEDALNRQAKHLSDLDEGLHFLEQKLRPVTRESPKPDQTDPEKAPRTEHSQVVAQIEYSNITLRRFIQQVRDITENLEV